MASLCGETNVTKTVGKPALPRGQSRQRLSRSRHGDCGWLSIQLSNKRYVRWCKRNGWLLVVSRQYASKKADGIPFRAQRTHNWEGSVITRVLITDGLLHQQRMMLLPSRSPSRLSLNRFVGMHETIFIIVRRTRLIPYLATSIVINTQMEIQRRASTVGYADDTSDST